MDLTPKDIEQLFRGSATPPSGVLPGEPPYTTRPVLTGTFGMVASTHWLGTASGIAMLEKGGTKNQSPHQLTIDYLYLYNI